MYNFKQVEAKWRKYWADNNTFKTDVWDFSKPKFYALDMFPYPSGSNLHAGHPVGYTATDIVARMKRMQGYNVLHPMGFDAYGLPAEQYAVNTGNHPDGFTQKNIGIITSQLKNLCFSYDWDRAIATSDPSYYKWTQWIFKQLYLDGLARYVDYPVNWCEELGCVLANDEIIDGKSERGGFPVVKKNMKQWVIDIPRYADRLLEGLDTINWPESTKTMQRNWIGRSEGVEVLVKTTAGVDFKIFTTCIETIYGITFFAVAPDGDIVTKLMPFVTNKEEVEVYKAEFIKNQANADREEVKDKTGVELKGIKAINPVNGKEVAIYAADFALAGYGTGALMAVPCHDQRDFDFAKKYGIEMIEVIDGGETSKKAFEKAEYLGKGCKLVNSAEFSGLTVEEAKKAITDKLVKEGKGEKKVNYHIREWIFARQRYWGEPVPVVHFEDGSSKALDDSELPLLLPVLDDYKPSKDGKSPLAKNEDWVNITVDGKPAKRETSTMPGSAGSSWYFLRYIDPENNTEIADKKLLEHWMPVDLYVGGPEHAVGHLLYSRMWNNYLFDKGIVPVKEPFKKLVHQGYLYGSNGMKMGKRYPEYVIETDATVENYGADSFRLYEMFMGPLEESKIWDNNGIVAAKKFIDRVFRLYEEKEIVAESTKPLEKIYHQTVKKVTADYETLNFNTAISQMMIFVNAVSKEKEFPREYAEGFCKLLNPICPCVTEEIWEMLGHKGTIAYESWPTFDESKLVEDIKNIVVQINGKLKKVISMPAGLDEAEAVKNAKAEQSVASGLDGKTVLKTIFVKDRLINFVVK